MASGDAMKTEANVTRVLSRAFAIPGRAGSATHRRAVLLHASSVLPKRRPGDATAALMDLGQLICRPVRPNCFACPIASVCVARRRGNPERYPRRPPPPKMSDVFVAAAHAVREDRALLVQRPGLLLGKLWQFPSGEAATSTGAWLALRRELASLGLRPVPSSSPFVTRHTIVHRRLRILVYRAIPSRRSARASRSSMPARWFTARELDGAAIPTLTRKIAGAFDFLPAARRPGNRRSPFPTHGRPAAARRRLRPA